jgi:anaerobic sulfite reductase subunit C
MRWTKEAEEAVSKVPFFVRRRVRRRVEEEATRRHAPEVSLEHVTACKRRYLENMDEEVKGHQLETCFGPNGCPNRAVTDDGLAAELEKRLSGKRLRDFLKTKVAGPLKMHHEFRVSISDCPNSCSRPQIVDFGVIAAARPRVSERDCSGCAACVAVCKEGAIHIDPESDTARVDNEKCLYCGQCVKICPAGALNTETGGYRILLGGKLGRHPQLASDLGGIFSKEQVLEVLEKCLEHHMLCNSEGERFGEILNRTGVDFLGNTEVDAQVAAKKSDKNANS